MDSSEPSRQAQFASSATECDWVLHVVPPNGGGVDRWLRDVLHSRVQDVVLHVASEQWVLESPSHGFIPVPAVADARALRHWALGRPRWVHAHAMTTPVMRAARTLVEALACPLGLSLHDVGFAEPDAEQSERVALLRLARWVLVPSHFLAGVARTWMVRMAIETRARPPLYVVANGWKPWPAAYAVPHPSAQGPFQVATVGALGQHKGLAFAQQLALALPPEVRIVLIGYADGMLTPGWLVPERLWVHGVFEPASLGALLAGYGAQLVWFAPGQPESFCYALSDAWQAGWPVMVPDQGALQERVRKQGFGTVYDAHLAPQQVAERLLQWLRVPPYTPKGDQPVVREPLVQVMLEHLQSIYGSEAAQGVLRPDWAALQTLAQTHLDSGFFRRELLRLQGDLQAAWQQNEALRAELRQLAQEYEARGAWIEKLERDIQEYEARGAWIEKLERDIETLNVALQKLQDDNATKPPSSRLGRWLGRKWLR